VLRGDQVVQLREEAVRPKLASARVKVHTVDDADLPLFNALKKCRKDLAESLGVPPYVVFHDATLKELALKKPTTKFW